MGKAGGLGFCPFSLVLFIGTATAFTYGLGKTKKLSKSSTKKPPPCQVVFVLGAPGSGKGTQCELLKTNMGWAHLSAGDLLRAERKRGGELADLINSKIAAGQIVPSHITCRLIQNGMVECYQRDGSTKFLVDGFPRSQGNVDAWNDSMQEHTVEFVLYLDCPEELLVGRLLERGKDSGRIDDNIEVIRKRFQTFQQESLPIVEQYSKIGKVRTIVADQSIDEVYKQVSELFVEL